MSRIIPGPSPGTFAMMFFIATSPTGVCAWKSSSSTWQLKLCSWALMYCCARRIPSDAGGRGPMATSCATCSNALFPSNPPVSAAGGAGSAFSVLTLRVGFGLSCDDWTVPFSAVFEPPTSCPQATVRRVTNAATASHAGFPSRITLLSLSASYGARAFFSDYKI